MGIEPHYGADYRASKGKLNGLYDAVTKLFERYFAKIRELSQTGAARTSSEILALKQEMEAGRKLLEFRINSLADAINATKTREVEMTDAGQVSISFIYARQPISTFLVGQGPEAAARANRLAIGTRNGTQPLQRKNTRI